MIAFAIMLLDHVGLITSNYTLRIIGRLAFPIFAFFITEGMKKTKNASKYIARLLMCAAISELAFDLLLWGEWSTEGCNVLFTLALAAVAIRTVEKIRNTPGEDTTAFRVLRNIFVFIAIIFPVLTAQFIKSDYYGIGVLIVLMFYYVNPNEKYGKLLQFVTLLLFSVTGFNATINFFDITTIHLESFCVLSLPLIWAYNGEQGYRNLATKIFFYSFYPVHLFLLYLLSSRA